MNGTTIIRDFEFTRDFRVIEWRATLWYNLLRATCAGIVFAILHMILPSANGPATPLQALALVPMLPIGYLAFVLPVSLLISLFSWVPFIGILGLALALTVAIGDPLVCLLKRLAPTAVPVDHPTLFSLTPVFWVLKADEYAIAS